MAMKRETRLLISYGGFKVESNKGNMYLGEEGTFAGFGGIVHQVSCKICCDVRQFWKFLHRFFNFHRFNKLLSSGYFLDMI